ncbi:hypothetical protein [Singulisphaera sp. PoT]|uniref:hypothetical protein n=1 Tax=Singulisphaera sp. PoT TaxID=3411797 RepID=UPI003BF5370D
MSTRPPISSPLMEKLRIAENALARIQRDAEYCYGKPFDWTARLGQVAKEAIAAMGDCSVCSYDTEPQYDRLIADEQVAYERHKQASGYSVM